MTGTATDTAHLYWNTQWQAADASSPWATAEPWVMDHARSLPPNSRVLDLGAGIGRHALAFAAMGHQVWALDAAEAAIAAIDAGAQAQGLSVATTLGAMTDLPFADGQFDHVLSWNVIYHGDEAIVRRCLTEIARVTKTGGTFMATMLSARRVPVERANAPGREISRNTWTFDGPGDKVHPHYFCNAADLIALMPEFELLTLFDRVHEKPGSWHWHLLAEKL